MEGCDEFSPESSDPDLQRYSAERIPALMPINVFVYNVDTRNGAFCNFRLTEILGYDGQLSGVQPQGLEDVIDPDDRESRIQVEQYLRDSPPGTRAIFECRMRHADGTWHWFGGVLTVFEREASGQPVSLPGATTEVTDSRLEEEQLRCDAGHDSLTGVLNRRQFVHELSHRIGNASAPLSFCFCDIDHFKSVNDRFGHAAGDEALSAFAQALRRAVRRDDVVTRLGGDEFCVLLPGLSAEEAQIVLNRIRRDLCLRMFAVDEDSISITASVGAADFNPGLTADQFPEKADAAHYQAKSEGRNRLLVAC
jgi:diguanylate cyclase (GGDEF)-like protein